MDVSEQTGEIDPDSIGIYSYYCESLVPIGFQKTTKNEGAIVVPYQTLEYLHSEAHRYLGSGREREREREREMK